KSQPGRFANEFHVQSQCGVAGDIKISLGSLDNEAARVSAVTSIRHAARMNRIHVFDPAEVEPERASVIHRVRLLNSLAVKPVRDFEVGNDSRASAFRDG